MRNLSAKADGVGDTLPATDFNANVRSELQNIVTSAGFTLDAEGGPDTDVEMLGKAVAQYANAAQYYQDSGAANAYVLARVGTLKTLTSYIDGVVVIFKAGNANTGASTINVASLGSKDLVDNAGAALVGGEVIANGYVIARYRSGTDDFEIIYSQSTADLPVPSSTDALQNIQVNANGDAYELAGPLTSFKNKIINGNFDFWDYATSQTSAGYGSDNRWRNLNGGSTKTHSQQAFTLGQTDVPGEPEFYSRTVAVTGSGASDYVLKQQRIESVRNFAGQTVALSFYAKADSSKNIATEFVQTFGTSGSPSLAVNAIGVTTHALTTSWQKFTSIVSIPSISGKTLGTDGNDYINLNIWLDAGSDFNSQTNNLGNQSGTFDIAQVQVEEGPVATKFENRAINIEKFLSNRFAFTLDIAKFSATTITIASGVVVGATNAIGYMALQSPMRATPTASLLSGSISVNDGGAGVGITGINVNNSDENNLTIQSIGAAGLVTGNGIIFILNGKLLFDAEL